MIALESKESARLLEDRLLSNLCEDLLLEMRPRTRTGADRGDLAAWRLPDRPTDELRKSGCS
jgi:hypothetical protein